MFKALSRKTMGGVVPISEFLGSNCYDQAPYKDIEYSIIEKYVPGQLY